MLIPSTNKAKESIVDERPVKLNTGVVMFVTLSVSKNPLSLEACRSGALGLLGACVSIRSKVSDTVAVEIFPATSMVWVDTV